MLILASMSVTRQALLAGTSFSFESRPPPIDERAIEASLLGKSPAEVSQALAREKALSVSRLQAGDVVIGADQTLAFGETLFHKPADMGEAKAQLMALRSKTHTLHAGVAIARDGAVLWSAVETARLTMRDFSEAQCDAVLAAEGDSVLGAVGAYRLESASIHLFERIEGDYFTILGLPLLPLLAALRRYAPQSLKGFT